MSLNFSFAGLTIHHAALWTVILLNIAGCVAPQERPAQPPPNLPAYHELAARHNANLDRIDRLWARAVVELHWQDRKGKHFEQGDGNLMVILSDRVALSVGKLGNAMLWAGCDDTRYWLFDLRDEPLVYVGSHAAAYHRDPLDLPIQVRPLDLVQLTGLVPIPPSPPGVTPKVDWNNGCYLIKPPGQQRRLWLDPQTARPKRIELLTPAGQSRVICRLSRWERMTIAGTPPGGFPWVATRMQMQLTDDEDATVTLFLSEPSDGRENNRIKFKAFNLDHLVKVFKPRRYVDLDAPEQVGPTD